jgi:plastocyanin
MSKRSVFAGLFLLAVSSSLLVSCSHAPEHKASAEVVRAELGADGVQRASILAGSYFFDPATVKVKVNVPVVLTIRKEEGFTPHNFTIREPSAGLDMEIPLSDVPQIIKFTATKTGFFNFYCSKKVMFMESHRDKGMSGILEVTE